MRLLAFLLAAPLLAQTPAPSAPAPAFNAQGYFLATCANCHGQDGSATRPDGKKGRATDLTDAVWQKANKDSDIANTIYNGKGHMPAFKTRISEAEVMVIVTDVVRKLQKGTPVKVAAATEAPAK
ncbi:MAG TPA: c-type cytochrome [Holophagaceae bacterium]|jgi:mono/diheme cytochrome c family protein|nr:c-type cytochrome [Holophagaceae bacterium]